MKLQQMKRKEVEQLNAQSGRTSRHIRSQSNSFKSPRHRAFKRQMTTAIEMFDHEGLHTMRSSSLPRESISGASTPRGGTTIMYDDYDNDSQREQEKEKEKIVETAPALDGEKPHMDHDIIGLDAHSAFLNTLAANSDNTNGNEMNSDDNKQENNNDGDDVNQALQDNYTLATHAPATRAPPTMLTNEDSDDNITEDIERISAMRRATSW